MERLVVRSVLRERRVVVARDAERLRRVNLAGGGAESSRRLELLLSLTRDSLGADRLCFLSGDLFQDERFDFRKQYKRVYPLR